MSQSIIPWAKPLFLGNEQKYVSKALQSTWVSSGEFVDKFEEDFRMFHNVKYGLTTSSGTSAIQLALLALGIKEGDEVIVPGFSFVTPANMVLAQKAKPVFIDIDEKTWCIDVDKIEQRITNKTKAIIVVHIYGNVCEMDKIRQLADRYNLFIIEDVAQAIFSKYKDCLAGTLGDMGCFSFQATKTITTGEGGFILMQKEVLFERCRKIRNHGMDPQKRYWHDCLGFNFRLTNLQAALGCVQMENIDKIISAKRRISFSYRNRLNGVKGITFQAFPADVNPVIWSNVIIIDPLVFKHKRDFMLQALLGKGIECRPGFYAFSEMPMYNTPKLPVAEQVGQCSINLPSYCSLTDQEIDVICENLLQTFVEDEIKI
jgi:perosamine synthetase